MDPATTTAARDLARAASVPTGSTGSTGSADHDATGATALAAHLVPLTRDRLRQVLDDALAHRNALTSALAQLTFSSPAAYGADRPDWSVGPFAPDAAEASEVGVAPGVAADSGVRAAVGAVPASAHADIEPARLLVRASTGPAPR